MKKLILSALLLVGAINFTAVSQNLKDKDVPVIVKSAFAKKYPNIKKVSW